MPVKKKSVSPKKRKEIREAANSIPGLIIEHVSFKNSDASSHTKHATQMSKYMLSEEKRIEHKKKRIAVFIAVGTIILALLVLWFVNISSFFFDTKHTFSNEEQLIDKIKQNFDTTVGLVSPRPTLPSSTENATVSTETLRAAVIAGLLSTSSTISSTTLTTSTKEFEITTTTTSTP